MTWRMLASRVYRIGVQTVTEKDGKYYVEIKNRSYHSKHQVTCETAMRYVEALRKR